MYILIILAALLLELILMCVLEDFLLMGIMILTIGFLILFSALKGHAKIKKAAVLMAVYCFVGHGHDRIFCCGKNNRLFP